MKRTAINIKDLEKIVGLNPKLARRVALRAGDKGLAIQDLSREDLLAIKGIGPKKADAILRLNQKVQVPTSPSRRWGMLRPLLVAALLPLVLAAGCLAYQTVPAPLAMLPF